MNQKENTDYFHRICNERFDDADLCELGFCGNDEVYLKFVVAGISNKYLDLVEVNCKEIFHFSLTKHPKYIFKRDIFVDGVRLTLLEDEKEINALLELTGSMFHINLPTQVFQFEVEGTSTIKIICKHFTLSERTQVFNND